MHKKMDFLKGISEAIQSIEEGQSVWTPDVIGPIFQRENIGLREVLMTHRNDKCIRTLATFVPDELIYETDISRKNFRKYNAVTALINVSRIFNLHEKFMNAENGGSCALFEMLNTYMGIIIEGVYYTEGDVIKISRDGLLVSWKISRDEFFSRTIYNVILYAQSIQEVISSVKNKLQTPKVDVVISAGEIIFSVIGDHETRHFVIGGMPIEDLKRAKRICLPGDVVLASSAWEHCAPSQYEYVIKDSSNVKIIRILGPLMDSTSIDKQSTQHELPETDPRASLTVTVVIEPTELGPPSVEIFPVAGEVEEVWERGSLTVSEVSLLRGCPLQAARVSVIETLKRRLGSHLRTYILKPVLNQINAESSLEYLTEVRKVTVTCVNVIPSKCSVYELISLIDELFNVLNSIVRQHAGCISTMTVYNRDILFHILYGIDGYSQDAEETNPAKNGVASAPEILNELKRVNGVKTVYVGMSTGMAFCGVVGHAVRRQYMVVGTPVDKAKSLMMVSFGKMSCDYDTVLYSTVGKEKFRSRGVKTLKGYGKAHVYQILDTYLKSEEFPTNIDYVYPIIGRSKELEFFKDILDDIGVAEKTYSGMLIEGSERSGKSRLLDAFAAIVLDRQITLLRLPVHESCAEKEFSVLYNLLLQLFGAKNTTTIEERERVMLNEFSDILPAKDFCYLNGMMKVQFPLSHEYCNDTDWERHMKTIQLFGIILERCVEHVCILLDDVQNMDVLSWKFLSVAMDKANVIVAMTLLEPVSWDNLTQVESGICQDKRLMNRSLTGLDTAHVTAFACQFLNVRAIPINLDRILQHRGKNAIAWCEAFLMSTLQVRALEFINVSPLDTRLYDLVFPDGALVTKIPVDMTPDELAPPLHWSQMSTVTVCIPSGTQRGSVETNRDVIGLRIDMYNRMNSYEQDFIKCAATLGSIFIRNMIGNLMINAAPLYTSKGKDDTTKGFRMCDDPTRTISHGRVDVRFVQGTQNLQQHVSSGDL
ncbi:Adenylate cyclase type 10 [Dufourea novaeangliae]|uniref:Adenylate cyclase type 10 n=1 Tax=Dufourea novaeangliae TaxID=178035 RepID=A0A154P2R7_DUFNO|nr:Adenylate cyclase type 10 [Dufourea novaeangliae]